MLRFPKGYGLGYGQTILKGDTGFKSPMLIVGANVYLRNLTTAAHRESWDVHVLFFPTSNPWYTVGIIGVSRKHNTVYFESSEGPNVDEAIKACVNGGTNNLSSMELTETAMRWLNNSTYRCPKISLKDVLSLEEYKKAS